MSIPSNLPPWMLRAIWQGDTDTLQNRAPCICCCAEHTFDHCAARLWGGCRGQDAITSADIDKWAKHYGIPRGQFLG